MSGFLFSHTEEYNFPILRNQSTLLCDSRCGLIRLHQYYVMSAAGGMAPLATRFYRCMADSCLKNGIVTSRRPSVSCRCRHSFCLLRSTIRCLRGFRSTAGHPARGRTLLSILMYICCLSEVRLCGRLE